MNVAAVSEAGIGVFAVLVVLIVLLAIPGSAYAACSIFPEREAECVAREARQREEANRRRDEIRRQEAEAQRHEDQRRWHREEREQRDADREAAREQACLRSGGRQYVYGQCIH